MPDARNLLELTTLVIFSVIMQKHFHSKNCGNDFAESPSAIIFAFFIAFIRLRRMIKKVEAHEHKLPLALIGAGVNIKSVAELFNVTMN